MIRGRLGTRLAKLSGMTKQIFSRLVELDECRFVSLGRQKWAVFVRFGVGYVFEREIVARSAKPAALSAALSEARELECLRELDRLRSC